MFSKFHTKSYKNIMRLVKVVLTILVALIIYRMMYQVYYEKRRLNGLEIVMILLAVCNIAIDTFSWLKSKKIEIVKWIKNWFPVLCIVFITLIIPIVVHFQFYRKEKIEESLFLTTYTTYLTFVGAICLGYFLYRKDERDKEKKLRKKARLLYENIFLISLNLLNIDEYIRWKIVYDILPSWRSDYADIKHLVTYNEPDLYFELEYFFSNIEKINKAIISGEDEAAKKLCSKLKKRESYTSTDYNYNDVEDVLYCIASDEPQKKPWKMREDKNIKKYRKQFFYIVSTWIYNYLLQNKISFCKRQDIEYELADWLATNPILYKWIDDIYGKRKITALISEISLRLSKESEYLDYYWDEYSLK